MGEAGAALSAGRDEIAAEVLGLGEALFDTLLESAASRTVVEDGGEPFPAEELRAAADELFRVLRMLLGVAAS